MGKIYCIMGKSSSGKDSIFNELKKRIPSLKSYVMYSTRPIRPGEQDGVSYRFVNDEYIEKANKEGTLIESRTYQTAHGLWTYATIDDDQFDEQHDMLMPATLESFRVLKCWFGPDKVVPVYIEVEDGERLIRAIHREQKQQKTDYCEMCRRFLADSEDFSEEKLKAAGITVRYENDDLKKTVTKITHMIIPDSKQQNVSV